ncbi:T9SS type A sorting domain-containing protein [Lewinella sp. LCG006]|uniref:T9SS type A sorting domain-containing protein n=1 Tax=Lewinella sp. LCG006 TaxID=3231911 RepID=UPI00345F6450
MRLLFPVFLIFLGVFLLHLRIAAQPENDEIATAFQIVSFPFEDLMVEFSSADTEGVLPASDGPCYDYNPMVWYKFQTASDGIVGVYNDQANYIVSIFYTSADLNADSFDDLVPVSPCFGSTLGVGTGVEANQNYYVMVGAAFDMDITFSSEVLLPVNLESFFVNQIEQQVHLIWRTQSESNNKEFIIERNINHQWEQIGSISGAGTSTIPNEYKFIDESPLIGTNFYRLRQIDFSGLATLSEIIMLEFIIEDDNVFLYPNPCRDLIQIYSEKNGSTIEQIFIRDINTATICYTFFPEPNVNQSIDISSLPQGTYLIQLIMEGSTKSQFFVKQ